MVKHCPSTFYTRLLLIDTIHASAAAAVHVAAPGHFHCVFDAVAGGSELGPIVRTTGRHAKPDQYASQLTLANVRMADLPIRFFFDDGYPKTRGINCDPSYRDDPSSVTNYYAMLVSRVRTVASSPHTSAQISTHLSRAPALHKSRTHTSLLSPAPVRVLACLAYFCVFHASG